MSLSSLRKKPRHVRERYLIAAMLVIAPALVVVWFVTFHYDSSTSGTGFFKSVGENVSSAFNSPVYKDTFGDTSFGKAKDDTTDPSMTAPTATTTAITTP